MKLLKKNQIIIYIIALMLITAGYLNFTTNNQSDEAIKTSLQYEGDDSKIADIGDAELVNSNDVISSQENVSETNTIINDKENQDNKVEMEANTSKDTIETNSNNNVEYFIKSKLERETMFSQMIETYEKILNSNNSLETQKQTATQEITKINEMKNKIMICENLIKTKGFEDNVIFVNGESINVILESDELKQEEVAQIQNIISREMNVELNNIHIANK